MFNSKAYLGLRDFLPTDEQAPSEQKSKQDLTFIVRYPSLPLKKHLQHFSAAPDKI